MTFTVCFFKVFYCCGSSNGQSIPRCWCKSCRGSQKEKNDSTSQKSNLKQKQQVSVRKRTSKKNSNACESIFSSKDDNTRINSKRLSMPPIMESVIAIKRKIWKKMNDTMLLKNENFTFAVLMTVMQQKTVQGNKIVAFIGGSRKALNVLKIRSNQFNQQFGVSQWINANNTCQNLRLRWTIRRYPCCLWHMFYSDVSGRTLAR